MILSTEFKEHPDEPRGGERVNQEKKFYSDLPVRVP